MSSSAESELKQIEEKAFDHAIQTSDLIIRFRNPDLPAPFFDEIRRIGPDLDLGEIYFAWTESGTTTVLHLNIQ